MGAKAVVPRFENCLHIPIERLGSRAAKEIEIYPLYAFARIRTRSVARSIRRSHTGSLHSPAKL